MKTITFYSYKGGVGRSLTLANIVSRLAEFNKTICLIDFDLEAPGLPIKFDDYINKEIDKGLVDYIYEYSNNGILPKNISDYSINFSIGKNRNLFIIPAGNIESDDYWAKLSSIDWNSFIYENPNGISFFLDLKQKIKKELNPDFLIIDSRTGVSEMSGITTSLLADEVVIVSANNKENLIGSKKIITSLRKQENNVLGEHLKLIFVLSRIPFTESPEDRAKEQNLADTIKNDLAIPDDSFFVIHSDREIEENEHFKIDIEPDGKSTIQITKDYLTLFERLTENSLSDDEKLQFEKIKQAKKLFTQAIQSSSTNERINILTECINLNPSNYEYYLIRGAQYSTKKDLPLMIDDFNKVIELHPNFKLLAINLIAEAYAKYDEYDNAIKYYNKALEINSVNNIAMIGLGDMYYSKKEYEKALELYTKSLQLYPNSFNAYNNRASLYKELGQYKEAFADIYKALELDPNRAIGYLTLAEIYAEEGNNNEFYLNFEIALSKDSILVERTMKHEKVYKRYNHEDRFIKLLDKYNLTYNPLS